jgi:hypothetical protein
MNAVMNSHADCARMIIINWNAAALQTSIISTIMRRETPLQAAIRNQDISNILILLMAGALYSGKDKFVRYFYINLSFNFDSIYFDLFSGE